VALMPNLCVVGEEIVTSETIVAANATSLEKNRGVAVLVEALAPVQTDHAAAWRTKLAKKLGDKLV
jgi:hypothetical protein